jgi:hypothetical protein
MMSSYLNVEKSAELLGLDTKTVLNLCRAGLLPGSRQEGDSGNWEIPKKAVDSLMKAGSSPQTSGRITSGDSITIGNVTNSTAAIGRHAQVIRIENYQDALFEKVHQRIAERPEEPHVDKAEIKLAVDTIQEEMSKGKDANPNKVERWLNILAEMAPDILDVVLAALVNPPQAVATVLRKVADKARRATPPG